MQILYAYFKHDGGGGLKKSEQELMFSINKSYDLYHYFFLLLIDIADYALSRIEIARNKHIPTYDDLHPNTRFVENRVISQLRSNKQLDAYLSVKKLTWINTPELIKELYLAITGSDMYRAYMENEQDSYKHDKEFIMEVLKDIVAQHEPLYQVLEEQSIYWNDEGEFILGANIKTIGKFKENQSGDAVLLPLYKSDEDKEFSVRLLRKVVLNHTEYAGLIKQYSKNWEVDRIAFMDILLMQMAIAEAIEFVSIPVKVTLNEYLELAKYYSTARSNVFLNGILDKVFLHLKETDKIKKAGRGLIGES